MMNADKRQFLFILGSARIDGNTELLARHAARSLPDPVATNWLRLIDHALPLFEDIRHHETRRYKINSESERTLLDATLACTDLVIASPVGPYFASGVHPVSIWVAEDYHRAGAGGTGAAKCGGNYAASLVAQQEAYAQGCEQVCFLDSETNTYLEELGGMNVFVVGADGHVATPELTGSILEGVTRSSIVQLLTDAGRTVDERRITLDEVRTGLESGEIAEVFACGTAAVVAPIGTLKGNGFVDEQPTGSLALELRQHLTDIQYGRAEDTHGWLLRLDA